MAQATIGSMIEETKVDSLVEVFKAEAKEHETAVFILNHEHHLENEDSPAMNAFKQMSFEKKIEFFCEFLDQWYVGNLAELEKYFGKGEVWKYIGSMLKFVYYPPEIGGESLQSSFKVYRLREEGKHSRFLQIMFHYVPSDVNDGAERFFEAVRDHLKETSYFEPMGTEIFTYGPIYNKED